MNKSTGPEGIDAQQLGVTGNGISIGQIEGNRAGRKDAPPADDPAFYNSAVAPTRVFLQTEDAPKNGPIDNHAEGVAGVMISKHLVYKGVAPDAKLFASAGNWVQTSELAVHRQFVRIMQHLALLPNEDVRAINMSSGVGANLDGTSLLTLGLDWSARAHDVLYVVLRGNRIVIPGLPLGATNPTDSYNGINVTASSKDAAGVFRKIWTDADFTPAAGGVG